MTHRLPCAEDPDLWFSEGNHRIQDAKTRCLTCPVRDLCLQLALGNDERFGIWGGLDAAERRHLTGRRTA